MKYNKIRDTNREKWLMGVIRANKLRKTHGMADTPIYAVWRTMLARCKNPNSHKYHLYGARGIKVCDKWKKFEGFFEDMGDRQIGMTIERIDNNGHYCKENCRWATLKEQARNRRDVLPVTINGVKATLQDIADILGIKYHALYSRLFVRNYYDNKAN